MQDETKISENEALQIEENAESIDVGAIPTGTGEPTEPEYQPKNKYERVLYTVYKDETLTEILHISSIAIVLLTVYAFFSRIMALIAYPVAVAELLIITGVPFIVVSVIRKIINAPRPYEVLEFYSKKPKAKRGQSFPSRHVFSVFVIATALMTCNAFLGLALILGGIILSVLRVILGIHFIRDVVAGGIIGIVSGAIGILVLGLIH